MAPRWLLLVLCLFLVGPASAGWWSRSSRPACTKIDCSWQQWSSWSACTDPCGNAGTHRRTRLVGTSASCAGRECNDDSSQTQACNRFCNNGGTPQAGHCDCPEDYWDTCCDKPCTEIANCVLHVCKSGTDQQCRKCEFDYGGDKKAYRLASSIFCVTVSAKPSITYCLVTAEMTTSSSSTEKAEISCENQSNTVIYTNVRATTVKIQFSSLFKGPSVVQYPKKFYINDFSVGVTDTKFTHYVVRDSLSLSRLDNSGCNSGISQDNPHTSLLECNLQNTMQNTPLQHADRVHFKASASNGGYVKIRNFDSDASGTVGAPKYYTGQTITHTAELVIDLVKPVHCSVGSTCSDNMLDRGPPITKATALTVRWAGWSDALARIKQYELALYKLQPYGDKLAHHGVAALVRKSLEANKNSFNTNLVDPGKNHEMHY
ncbi:hypothetical protein LSAT2_013874 [Lamellibrachia satsuma]|nr:hypothetical protein LSAT2_013874 [Lamellibrachia satsuma]